MMNNVIHPDTGKICTYSQLSTSKVPNQDKNTWTTSLANIFRRLAAGVGDRIPSGTNTINSKQHTAVPKDRHVTYGKIVCGVRKHKAETHRCRLTVGGDKLEYPDEVSTPTSDLTTAKYLVNSIFSTPGAKGLVAGVKDFYINTTIDHLST